MSTSFAPCLHHRPSLVPIALVLLCLIASVGTARAQGYIGLSIPTSHFVVGRSYPISYNVIGVVEGRIRLEYSVDSMKSWKLIDTLAPITGQHEYRWLVPDDTSETAVMRLTLNGAMHTRTQPFVISRVAIPILRLFKPWANMTLFAGTETEIIWSAQDISGRLAVEYSVDTGAAWIPIAEVPAREGMDTLSWIVPSISMPRARMRVRTSDSSTISQLPGVFVVRYPSLTILQPNGGERLMIDSLEPIIWSATDLTGRVELSYSTDLGAFWYPIDARWFRPGLDTFYWPVPAMISSTVEIRVLSEDGRAEDRSDGHFQIVGLPTAVRDESSSVDRPAIVVPNPARASVELVWQQVYGGAALVRLVDPAGRTALQTAHDVEGPGVQRVTLDLRGIPAGSYVYEITAGRQRTVGSIVVAQ